MIVQLEQQKTVLSEALPGHPSPRNPHPNDLPRSQHGLKNVGKVWHVSYSALFSNSGRDASILITYLSRWVPYTAIPLLHELLQVTSCISIADGMQLPR